MTIGNRAELRGHPEATDAIGRLVEALGRDAWATARSLELEYRGWHVLDDAILIERAWRDLSKPLQRLEFRTDALDLIACLTPSSSWRREGGVISEATPERLQEELAFWPRDFYTLMHRFAMADRDLHYDFREGRVVIHSQRLGELGWFEIDGAGCPIRWGTHFRGRPLEYVYGMLRDFGSVSFPAWGAATDGSWRFEYVRVEVTPEPLAESLCASSVLDGSPADESRSTLAFIVGEGPSSTTSTPRRRLADPDWDIV